jgi:glycosyltransferase involved in cell wall biosynthesis
MESKNILHIITVSFVINHFFGNQFNYLKKRTGNRYFLGCSPSDDFMEKSVQLGYEPFPVVVTRSISPFTDLKAIFRIYKFIKKNNIDVVVGHTPKGGMVSMIAAFFAGVDSRIYFRHGIIYETSGGLKRFLLKLIDTLSGSLATKVVCVSNSVKKISERDRLNDVRKNVILGLGTCNGIDTENRFNPMLQDQDEVTRLKRACNISDEDLVVGYVGRIVRDKGINELIAAWKILKENYSHIKLLLVGPVEVRDAISAESLAAINNDPTIISTGTVAVASPYFSMMDIFVLPTYREGFPTVALEAASMKLPVVITRATGCEESIREGETGLFTTNAAEDIAQKTGIYLQSETLRQQHGESGRVFVRKNFKETIIWDRIHQQLGY